MEAVRLEVHSIERPGTALDQGSIDYDTASMLVAGIVPHRQFGTVEVLECSPELIVIRVQTFLPFPGLRLNNLPSGVPYDYRFTPDNDSDPDVFARLVHLMSALQHTAPPRGLGEHEV